MFHVEQGWGKVLREGAHDLQITLDDDHIAQFQRYLKELKAWNGRINLTSITDNKEIAIKHFLDSLLCSKVLIAGPLLDIGSGAGFPGLPLKILHPDLDVTLLEPNRKKTAFLHHLIGTLQLKRIVVVSRTVEELADDTHFAGRFANLVTRALDVQPFFQQLRSLITSGGRLILCRSRPLETKSRRGSFELLNEVRYTLPGGLGERVLAVLQLEGT
jgi:16S rRNA (guanine527-N7)-methyltransferase